MNKPYYGIDLGRTELPQQHRFFLWGVIALFMVLAVWMGTQIGEGGYQKPMIIVAVLLGMGIGLWMGDKVWLLVPAAFLFNVEALPFGGRKVELSELACAGVAMIALMRFATRSQPLKIFRGLALGVTLYFCWAIFIYVMNPVGLAIMGSSDVGLRFYFKLALGFAAFLVMSNQKIGEWECQLLIKMTLIGSIFTTFVGIMAENLFQQQVSENVAAMNISGYSDGNAYTWHQSLSGPAMAFSWWLFCRYRVREIFSLQRLYLPLIYAVALILALYSGKRAGFLSVLVMPMIALIVHREWKPLMLGGFIAAFGLTIMVVGHGSIFTLPYTVQRAIVYLPGTDNWEAKRQFADSADPFRQKMRELAWEKIEQAPIIGKGFGLDVKDYMRLVSTSDYNTILMVGLAMGSAWHNTWLGIWADFGFPPMIFWAIFRLQLVWVSWKIYKMAEPQSSVKVIGLMYFVYAIQEILTSWTSGHSALDAYGRWWHFGMLISVYSGLLLQKQAREKAKRLNERKLETPSPLPHGHVA